MKKQGKPKGQVVGFYKDHGKTKPITKSTADVQRKRIVREGQVFKSVGPKSSLSERLESLIEELQMVENNSKILTEQKKQLLEQGLEVSAIDQEMQEAKAQAMLLKNRIRHLHCHSFGSVLCDAGLAFHDCPQFLNLACQGRIQRL